MSAALQCDGARSSEGLLGTFNSALFCREVRLTPEHVKSILPQLATGKGEGEALGSGSR